MQATKGRLYGAPVVNAARIGGQCRALWNLFLAETCDRYRAEKKFVFYAEMSARLPKLLREDARLSGLPHRAAQMTVQRLDRALKDCAKNKGSIRRGFPKFKRRDDRADAFSFVGRECRFEPGRVRLPKIGWVRVRGLVLSPGAEAKQVAVTQEPDGWYVSVQFEAPPKRYAEPMRPVAGVDDGLAHQVTLSDGTKIEAPRFARKAEKRIRRLNRERDRRRKGSVNCKRTVAKLSRTHRRVRNKRRDHAHKTTRWLVDTYAGFAIQKSRLKGLARTRLAKSVADVGLGEVLRLLRYKAEWAGREWREMPRFERSTGVCPKTYEVGAKLPLSVRKWHCQTCGAVHDRDVAAAQVILRRAVGAACPEPAGAVRRKRGAAVRDGVRPVRTSHGGPPTNIARSQSN